MEHKWNLKIKTTRCFSFYSNRCCVSTCLCSCSLKTKHLYPQSHSVMQFKWRGCMVCELHLNEAVKTINFFKRKSWLSPPWFTLLLTSILRNPEPHSGRCSRFLNPKHKNHNFVLTLRLATWCQGWQTTLSRCTFSTKFPHKKKKDILTFSCYNKHIHIIVSMRVWELSCWWIAALSWGWGGTLPPFHYWTCCINVQNSQEMQRLIPALVPTSWVTDLTQVTSLLRWEEMSGPGNLQGGCQHSRSMIWCPREINQILCSGMSAKRYRKQKIHPVLWMNFSFTRGD